jgi:hypothetical protein
VQHHLEYDKRGDQPDVHPEMLSTYCRQ